MEYICLLAGFVVIGFFTITCAHLCEWWVRKHPTDRNDWFI